MYYPAAEIVFEAKPQIHVYVEQTLGYSSTSELLSVHSFLIFLNVCLGFFVNFEIGMYVFV